MSEQKQQAEAAAGQSRLTDVLERLIDGDVTCWGIDDVIAYGLKVAAMQREACAILCETGDIHEALIPEAWLKHADLEDEEGMTRLYCAATIRAL